MFTCKTLKRSVKHFSCVTEVARDVFSAPKGTLCCFDLEATKFHLGSDEVVCLPEILSGGFTQSLLILVDIEYIDYS